MSDLISRQAAIDVIEQHKTAVLGDREWDEGIAYGYAAAHRHLVDIVKQLPSVERHGRWIDKYNDGDWHCSECGAIVEKDEQNRHNWYRCYHCGAKMDEVEE